MSEDTAKKPPCECCERSRCTGKWYVDGCDCGNTGDTIEAAYWCGVQNTLEELADEV